jgi:hypothetical protein
LILITGPRRTGTTLLNSVVCSDPAVNPLIAEAQLLTRFAEAFAWGRGQFAAFGRNFFDDAEDYRRFYADFAGGFVARTLSRYQPATHLALKNPEFSFVAEDLRLLLPDAKFLCAVRDPRDQVVSEYETGLRQIQQGLQNRMAENRDFRALAAASMHYYRPLLQAADTHGESFLFVRYEDLVLHTADTLGRLRDFTGLTLADFDRDAPWSRVEIDWGIFGTRPFFTPFYGQRMEASRVGRFADVLSPEEVRAIEDVCRPVMERFHYECGPT